MDRSIPTEKCPGSRQRVRAFRARCARGEKPVYCPHCDCEVAVSPKGYRGLRGSYVLIGRHRRQVIQERSRDAWWRPLADARANVWPD